MKLKPYYLGLVLLILLGLTASSAFGVGNPGTITGGTFPACVDPATANASTVKIAGKQVNPGGLVRVPTGTTCLPSETTLNLNSYLKTVLVSPGPTNIASGTNLQNALTAATPGTLVKIEPGTYDLGTNSLTMKAGVDLEGSGDGLTKITSQVGDNNGTLTAGTIVLASNSEIRFLTITNSASKTFNTVVYSNGVNKTARLFNVTLTTTGGGNNSSGIYNDNSSPTIEDSTITTSANSFNSYGIYNISSSSPTIKNSTIIINSSFTNSYGIYNISSSSPTIRNSTITGSANSGYGYGIYNSYSSSPTIQGSTISASGGSSFGSYGIYNLSFSSPTIQGSTITNSGNGGYIYGIYNDDSSSPTIQSSTITNSGNGYANYGIANHNSSSPTIQNSTITTSGNGTSNYGSANIDSFTTIQNSTISASGGSSGNISITNLDSSAKVGVSQLVGGVSGAGFTCIGAYNGNFAALSPTCQ